MRLRLSCSGEIRFVKDPTLLILTPTILLSTSPCRLPSLPSLPLFPDRCISTYSKSMRVVHANVSVAFGVPCFKDPVPRPVNSGTRSISQCTVQGKSAKDIYEDMEHPPPLTTRIKIDYTSREPDFTWMHGGQSSNIK